MGFELARRMLKTCANPLNERGTPMLALVPTASPKGLFRAPFDEGVELEADVSDAELVAALIRDGEPPRESLARARGVLDVAGGLYGLGRASTSHLQTAGLPEEVARRLQRALLLGRRVSTEPPPQAPVDARTVAAMYRSLLGHLSHEELHVVLLDRRCRYLGRRRLASGGSASVTVHVRDVMGPVMEARAQAFVLVHNHPSGIATPSPEDVRLSQRIEQAGDVLGTRLIDHLVVTAEDHASAMPAQPAWLRGQR